MIVGLIVNTLAFIAIAELLPGFRIRSHGTAFVVAVLYAVLHVATWWLLAATLIAALAALFVTLPPLAFLAGLASFFALPILTFFISVLALIITDKMMDSLSIDGWGTTFLAALLLALINAVTGAMFGI